MTDSGTGRATDIGYTPRDQDVRLAYVAAHWDGSTGSVSKAEFDRWLAHRDAALLAPVREVIDSLDTARGEGRIYTYGQIQQALRKALP